MAEKLDLFMSELRKTMKSDLAVHSFGGGAVVNIPATPTGIKSLDDAIGIGGLPNGRMTELFGPESGGKTTLALQIIASVHKQSESSTAFFVDAEHALDVRWAERLGVDIDRLAISQPDCGEEAYNLVENAIKSKYAPNIIVVDSIPALIPKSELEGEIGDASIGLQARMNTQAMRKIITPLSKAEGTVLILINQVREKIGGFTSFSGPVETTPGGRAIKHAASCRIKISKGDFIKAGADVVGIKIRTKMVKNKVGPPYKTADFNLMYDSGVDERPDIFMNAVFRGVLEKRGGWYYLDDERKYHGQKEVLEAMLDDEFKRELLDLIDAAVLED